MSLEEIDLPHHGTALEPEIQSFLREANRRVEAFIEDPRYERHRGFIPSDYEVACRALAAVRERGLAPGNTFCEWGSGFGVVASLAALLGFEAYGIEIEDALYRASCQLAHDFDLPVRFSHETFLPSGYDFYIDGIARSRHLIRAAADVPQRRWEHEWGVTSEDLDVVYVYPWPGETEFVEDLFDATAPEGALLMMGRDDGELQVMRRIVEDEPGLEGPEADFPEWL